MPKLRPYKYLKQPQQDNENTYVTMNLSISARSKLAKMRTGTFPINIELGRYRNIPIENRLCETCDQKHIENETHFLLNCDAYNNLRVKLYHELNIDPTNMSEPEILDYVLCGRTEQTCLSVSAYITEAYQLRNCILSKL